MSADGGVGSAPNMGYGAHPCQQCGAAIPANARFCGACGHVVVASAHPAAGGAPTQRGREILRRLLPVLCAFLACAAFFFAPKSIVEVSVRDLAADYLEKANAGLPMTQFVDRSISVVEKDPAWAKLAEEVEREVKTTGATSVFYPEDHPLVAGRNGTIAVQDGARRHTLSVASRDVRSRGWSSTRSRPSWRLTSPLALYGIPFLLLAPAPYFLLRWKAGGRDVRYKGWVTLVFDVLGLVTVGCAGALFGTMVAEGITAACVGAAIVGVFAAVFLGASTYYACLRAFVLPGRVRVMTLFRTLDFPFDQIQLATLRKEPQSIVLGVIMIVIGLTNLVGIVAGLVLILRKHYRLTLRRTDGKTFRIWIPTSVNVHEELVPALRTANVRWLDS